MTISLLPVSKSGSSTFTSQPDRFSLPPMRRGSVLLPGFIPRPIPPHKADLSVLVRSALIPIDQKIGKEDVSFKVQINKSFRWVTVQIGCLFEAIYREGLTDLDATRAAEYREQLNKIKRQIKCLQISELEKKHAKALLAQTCAELDEIEILCQDLSFFYALENKLSKSLETLTLISEGANTKTNLLQSLPNVFISLKKYRKLLQTMNQKHALMDFLERSREGIEYVLQDWADDLRVLWKGNISSLTIGARQNRTTLTRKDF